MDTLQPLMTHVPWLCKIERMWIMETVMDHLLQVSSKYSPCGHLACTPFRGHHSPTHQTHISVAKFPCQAKFASNTEISIRWRRYPRAKIRLTRVVKHIGRRNVPKSSLRQQHHYSFTLTVKLKVASQTKNQEPNHLSHTQLSAFSILSLNLEITAMGQGGTSHGGQAAARFHAIGQT